MKKYILGSFVAFFLSVLNGSSQVPPLPNDPSTYAVLIAIGPALGSGFVVGISNSVFLVTARHVLYDVEHSPLALRSTSATFIAHSNAKTTATNVLDLAILEKAGEVRYSPDHDVAMVRIGKRLMTNTNQFSYLPGVAVDRNNATLTVIPKEFLQRFDDTPIGTDVFIFGYPESIGLVESPQLDFSSPLLRKGIIAGRNTNLRCFILDCPAYEGNSGGPVVVKFRRDAFNEEIMFVGIVSQWVPFRDVWVNQRFGYVNQNLSNSGYSIAEPIDAILDMAW